jgi:hypothetical protein
LPIRKILSYTVPNMFYSPHHERRPTMRLDTNLLRRMLETVEQAPAAEVPRVPRLQGGEREHRRHVQALIDGGYLYGQQLRRFGPAVAVGLTLDGQRLLDELRRGSDVPTAISDVARRVVAGVAVGVLVAKAKGLEMLGG